MQADRANTSLTPRVAFAEGLSENKSHLNEPCPDAKSATVDVAEPADLLLEAPGVSKERNTDKKERLPRHWGLIELRQEPSRIKPRQRGCGPRR